MRFASRSISLVAVIATLVGCGAPADIPVDAGPIEPDAAPLEWPVLSVGTTIDPDDPTRIGADAVPADLSCLGVWSWPEPTAPVPFELRVDDFFDGTPVADICIRGYLDGTIDPADTCDASDVRTSSAGLATIEAPGRARFAVRSFARPGLGAPDTFLETLNFGMHHYGTGPVSVPALSVATINQIVLVSLRDRALGTATIGATLADCRSRPVYGARIRLFREDGSPIVSTAGRTGTVMGYGNGSRRPSVRQPWTHIEAIFAATNIVVETPGEVVYLEGWGRIEGESEPRIISCAQVQILPDAFSVAYANGVLRASSPSCPGLR